MRSRQLNRLLSPSHPRLLRYYTLNIVVFTILELWELAGRRKAALRPFRVSADCFGYWMFVTLIWRLSERFFHAGTPIVMSR